MFHKQVYHSTKIQPPALGYINYTFPTTYECAQMSADAYNTIDNRDTPPGWQCFKVSEKNGVDYFGKCYIKDWGTLSAKLVFAHRGTVLSSMQNVLGDIEIVMEKAPRQCIEAFNFMMQCFIELNIFDEYQVLKNLYNTVTQTGHSLGAVIADAMTGYLSMIWGDDKIQRCITFENPGSKISVIDFWKNIVRCQEEKLPRIISLLAQQGEAYQAGVNIINNYAEQAVKTFRIKDLPCNLDAAPAYHYPTESYLTNLFYLIENTTDQHKISKIKKFLSDRDAKFIPITYAVGLKAGYIHYLDLSNNNEYWQKYFETIWSKFSEEEKNNHNNDFNKYLKWGFELLKDKQRKAMENIVEPNANLFNNSHVLFKPKTRKNSIDRIIDDFVIINKTDQEEKSICKVM